MSIFEAVKQSVTTRQAAKHFGIRAGRNGMCRCPFHADRNPSMKVDRRYYCFGCGATGDVIDFVSRLEGISPKEAALLLARAFSVPYEDKGPPGRSRPLPGRKRPEQQFRRMERYCLRVLCDYRNRLGRWKRDYAPQGAGGRMESFVCGSPAKAGLCGLSAGCAALPGYGGTGSLYHRLWKGSEQS